MGVRDILDHPKAMTARDCQQRIHLGRVAAVVDHNEGARVRSYAAFDILGIEAKRTGIDVGEK